MVQRSDTGNWRVRVGRMVRRSGMLAAMQEALKRNATAPIGAGMDEELERL